MLARITNKSLHVAFVLALAAALTAGLANRSPKSQETAEKNVMIVLDGSGSMWGKLGQDSDTKLALSQKFMSEMLNAPTRKGQWGIASFGHRRAGNCSDAQVLVPPEPNSKDAVLRVIEKHNPRGKGPLSLALTKTAEVLDPATDSAIVLVHDGYDNCRQNPCDVADSLSKTHPKLAIHVISLDLPDQTMQAMSCLAKKTGGQMYPVRTAADFSKAADDVLDAIVGAPPASAARGGHDATTQAKATDPSNRTQGPPRIRVSALLNDDPALSVRDVAWQILSPASPQQPLSETEATELKQPLQPGRYIIRARSGLAENEAQVTINEQGETALQLSFDAGVLQLTRSSTLSDPDVAPGPAFVTLRPGASAKGPDQPAPLWIGAVAKSQSLVVPTGTYHVEAGRGPKRNTQTVTISAGEVSEIDVANAFGVLQLSSAVADPVAQASPEQPQPTDINAAKATYIIRIDDPTRPGGRRELARSAAANATFRLQPGTVYVEAQLGRARQEQRFAITNGTVLRHTFEFNVATVALDASIGGVPVSDDIAVTYSVFDISQPSPRRVAVVSRKSANLMLPAGRYRIRAEVAPLVSGTIDTVTLLAGQPLQATVPLNAGRIALLPPASDGRASLPRLQIRQDSDNGKVVWSGRVGRRTLAVLAPGQYVLEERSKKSPMRRFAITPGETIELRSVADR